jgi:hypothetical protein
LPVGRQESDELHDLDQRARRRLGQAESVEHLAGTQPAVVLDRLLRDVGEHRVRAAEGDGRHLREEQRDLREHVGAAERGEQQRDGRRPERSPERCDAQRARERRLRVGGRRAIEQRVDGGRRVARAGRGEPGHESRNAALQRESERRRAEHDQRKRDP